jgi:hypothetical protein
MLAIKPRLLIREWQEPASLLFNHLVVVLSLGPLLNLEKARRLKAMLLEVLQNLNPQQEIHIRVNLTTIQKIQMVQTLQTRLDGIASFQNCQGLFLLAISLFEDQVGLDKHSVLQLQVRSQVRRELGVSGPFGNIWASLSESLTLRSAMPSSHLDGTWVRLSEAWTMCSTKPDIATARWHRIEVQQSNNETVFSVQILSTITDA